ncbi:MAG: hypothetical protein ACKVJF_04720 [Flavobacteriales bacterium]
MPLIQINLDFGMDQAEDFVPQGWGSEEILYRIIHTAIRFELKGEAMRNN